MPIPDTAESLMNVKTAARIFGLHCITGSGVPGFFLTDILYNLLNNRDMQ